MTPISPRMFSRFARQVLLLGLYTGLATALHFFGTSMSESASTAAALAQPEFDRSAASLEPVAELRLRSLQLPIDGMNPEHYKGSFYEARGGRRHEAIDILAPRNSPIVAVEAGTIRKLFISERGGLTIYQFDPTERYTYYYAHLERYAEGLREGNPVSPGQVIGYVGTSGNAAANTPHLHFAIFQLGSSQKWWEGTPIDPYPVFSAVE